MVKVLIVGLSEEVGGIENLFYNLLKETIKDCQFDFLAFGNKCAYENYFRDIGSKIYYMPTRKSCPLKFNKLVKNFLVNHNGYDYIWINTSSTSMYQFQYFGKKYTNSKIITHSHGTSIDRNNGIFLFLANKVLEILNKQKVVNNTDLFLCCSLAAGKALYGEKYVDKLIMVKNGIDVKKYKFSLVDRMKKRAELQIKDSTTVFSLIGRLSPQKNPLKALEIFAEYYNKNRNSILLIIGDGYLKQNVINYINDNDMNTCVKILGFRKDVPELMSCSDILLMPSLFEGLPLTAIEAECNGLECYLSENITVETKIVPQCYFVSIKDSSKKWVRIILESNCINIERENCYKNVLKNQYSIEDTREYVRKILIGEISNV